MKFDCPHCQQRVEAQDSLIGTSALCPGCNQAIVIPSSSPIVAEPQDEKQKEEATWQQRLEDAKTWGCFVLILLGILGVVGFLGSALLGGVSLLSESQPWLWNLLVLVALSIAIFFTWKGRSFFTPKRLQASYLAWAFSHALLLFFSKGGILAESKLERLGARKEFYPVDVWWRYGERKHSVNFLEVNSYDFLEFFVYLVTPLVLWWIVRLWIAGKPGAS